jgi:DNA-binding response OmpR family regulator
MTQEGTRRKVLIDDDDPKLRSFVSRQLQTAGYATEVAADG